MDAFRNQAPVPFVGRGMAGKWGDRARRGDQAAELSAMGASAALFGIVNRTSTAVAKETWHLHRARPAGRAGTNTPASRATRKT